MTAFLTAVLRHALGYSSPRQAVDAFMRLVGVFALAGLALGVAFPVFGWSATDPVSHLGRWLLAALLATIAAGGAWFILGGAAGLARAAAAPTRDGARTFGRDSLIVTSLMAALAMGWAGRGAALLFQGAPVTEAVGWRRVVPWGTVAVQGEAIVARGVIGPAFAADVRRALADQPEVTTLRIDSGGGVASSGDRIAALVRAAGLDVVVSRYCASACLPIFLAGERRVLAPGARLGCHQMADAITGASAGAARSFRDVRPPEGGRALHARIVAVCDATPPSAMHTPALGDLAAIGAVTHVGADPRSAAPASVFCAQHSSAC